MIRTETIERDGRSIAVVLLDRPEKRNALTPDMLAALCTALEEAPKTHDAVVLAGEGKLFCAGFDLSLCKDDPSGETMRKLLTRLSRACTIMRRTEKPVVIAAHGAAIAGGCALLGGGDVVVSDIHAKLGYPVTKIGVSPAVSAPFLSYNVTTGTSREMLLVPELVSGEAAHAKSLVHELVDLREDVRDKAISIAANLADKPSHAYAATKSLLNQLEGTDDGEAFRLALDASLALTGGEEEQRLLAQLDL
ncbi:MAG: enoyl-CoA hydratase/isomerase family protein [Phycisphaerales bacterium]|nr:enoyl-CoA hydratase/isomerase family protein [Phycisphaerales bacterium]MCB9836632.1 enoyl-CoA hydratase/isomerase family protein [Phycisphaera sp.]